MADLGGFFATLGQIAGRGSGGGGSKGRSRSRDKKKKRGKPSKPRQRSSSSSGSSSDSWTKSKCRELRLVDYQKKINKLNMEQLEQVGVPRTCNHSSVTH